MEFNLEYKSILFVLFIIVAFGIIIKGLIKNIYRLLKSNKEKKEIVFSIRKPFVYRMIIIVVLLGLTHLSDPFYNLSEDIEEISFIEFIKIADLDTKMFYITLAIIGIITIINSIVLFFSKIGIYKDGILDEFGEFIHWNRITGIAVEDSAFGMSRVIHIKTKNRKRKGLLSFPYRIVVKKSESVEITTFISEKIK